MTLPTLHQLLWGPTLENSNVSKWSARPWEIPAVGLPTRISMFLFQSVQGADPQNGWTPDKGPLTWRLSDPAGLLSLGRRYQLGFANVASLRDLDANSTSTGNPSIERSTDWVGPIHPAYWRPWIVAPKDGTVDRTGFLLYCDVLLLLTAMDGGEKILDRLVDGWIGTIPINERWDWRSRIHLPPEAWEEVERALRWSEAPELEPKGSANSLAESFPAVLKLGSEDFITERVDLRLGTPEDPEIVRTVRSPGLTDNAVPDALRIRESELLQSLTVRIGQVSVWPAKESVLKQFPGMSQVDIDRIMEQVHAAFRSPNHDGGDEDPDLVLLPEVTIPRVEIQSVRDLVSLTGRASLAGLYWRELRPVYEPAAWVSPPSNRWFVNEAELVIPLHHEDRGPTLIRWYRIRKPIPSHVEIGLASALERGSRSKWKVLRGHRWYRFVHPGWGDFTIAICSDLLDTAPWRSLRGELLHLFMVGFNKDVDLFDSLTWIRAYENFVNLVAVNHGSYGGSFLWTPQRSHNREIARLRGGDLFLLADVKVPVRKLFDRQLAGAEDSVDSFTDWWLKSESENSRFKSPPPGFIRRA